MFFLLVGNLYVNFLVNKVFYLSTEKGVTKFKLIYTAGKCLNVKIV